MQGHAFMGTHAAPPQPYLYGFRGRMDERYDLVRSVRDQRYIYIRNFMPHKIYGQFVSYMFETPTTRVWKEHYDQGRLQPPQTAFWEPKPSEELYDLKEDPDETRNLAQSPAHQDIRRRLAGAQSAWVRQSRDVGFLPEDEIHSRARGTTPFDLGHDPRLYDVTNVVRMAERASLDGAGIEGVLPGLTDPDSAVRYWALLGIIMRGSEAVTRVADTLRGIQLQDDSPSARVLAAEALAKYGDDKDLKAAMDVLIEHASAERHSVYVAMLALNAIDDLDLKAKPWIAPLSGLPNNANRGGNARTRGYVPRLLEKLLADLE
jgi:uncharacterized sulfatase